MTFSWAKQLIDHGNEKTVEMEDIWLPDPEMEMENVSRTFEGFYQEEVRNWRSKQSVDTPPVKRSLKTFLESPLSLAVVRMYWEDFIRSGSNFLSLSRLLRKREASSLDYFAPIILVQ